MHLVDLSCFGWNFEACPHSTRAVQSCTKYIVDALGEKPRANCGLSWRTGTFAKNSGHAHGLVKHSFFGNSTIGIYSDAHQHDATVKIKGKKRKARMRKMIDPAVYATRKNMFHQALFVLSCDAVAHAPDFSKWVEKEWKSVHINLSAGVLLVASSQKQQKTEWRRAYTWPCCGNPSKSFRQTIRLFSQTWHTCLSLWSGLRRSNDGVLAWRLRLQVQRYVNPWCMKCCKGIT